MIVGCWRGLGANLVTGKCLTRTKSSLPAKPRFTLGLLCTIVLTSLGTLAARRRKLGIWGRDLMWNKSAEAKPSSQAADTSVPVIPAPVVNAQQTQPVSTPIVPPVAQV